MIATHGFIGNGRSPNAITFDLPEESESVGSDPRKLAELTSVKPESFEESPTGVTSYIPEAPTAAHTSFDAVVYRGISDDKYGPHGRYGYDPLDAPPVKAHSNSTLIHKAKIPDAEALRVRSSVDDLSESGKIRYPFLPPQFAVGTNCRNSDGTRSDYPTSSSGFVDMDSDDESQDGLQPNRTRKRKLSDIEQPAIPWSATSFVEPLNQLEAGVIQDRLFAANGAFEARGPTRHAGRDANVDKTFFIGNDRTFIQIAQMVADQAISGVNASQDLNDDPYGDHNPYRWPRRDIESTMIKLSMKYSACTLKEFADVEDQDPAVILHEQVASQQWPAKPTHPPRATMIAAQSVAKLQTPNTCIQRAGSSIDIAPSALPFWEELSLAPSHGPKDITAYCIYPAKRAVKHGVQSFLTLMQGAYQICNLGKHDVGPVYAGLVPVEMNLFTGGSTSSELDKILSTFGNWLGKTKFETPNIVIYMLDASNDDKSLPPLCGAFLKLFDAYNSAVKEVRVFKPSDLALRIVPLELVASKKFVPLPSPAIYSKIAFEVYDSCGPHSIIDSSKTAQYNCAPAIRLAKNIPKAINFRLTPESSALDLHSDNCIHVGYSWDPGSSWLTASWTDNLGTLSWNACYCFQNVEAWMWRSFEEIANDIFQTTAGMLRPRKNPWMILICKDGVIHKRELESMSDVVL